MAEDVKENVVYGPVPSWRFGLSLGIDPTLPPKKCSYGCIYCQLGITQNYYVSVKSDPSFPGPDDLDRVLANKLSELDISSIDVVMFSGTGEPTLNPLLGDLIDVVRKYVPDKPVGILSNGSFIGVESVFSALQKLDIVSLKLDSAVQESFERINRPAKGLPSIRSLISDYKRFNKVFDGTFGLEVMLLKTVDGRVNNLVGSDREALFNAIQEIDPDVVELEVPYRPPAESKVIVSSEEEIMSFARDLRALLGHDRVWVYGEKKFDRRKFVHWTNPLTNERIVNLLRHRPCRIEDLVVTLGGGEEDLGRRIAVLVEEGVVSSFERDGDVFYYVSVAKRR